VTSRIRALTAVWFVLAVLAAWVTACSARETAFATPPRLAPQQVYGDACPNTCPPLDECREWWIEGPRYQHCCVWDWGCWLNPQEPNYQLKPCRRTVLWCLWVEFGDPFWIRCCNERERCWEVNGEPCCHPLYNVRCP